MALGANMAPKSFQNGARGGLDFAPVFGLGRLLGCPGGVLGGSWGPRGFQNREKCIKKGLICCTLCFIVFFIDFGSFLGGFLVDFQCQVEGQVE